MTRSRRRRIAPSWLLAVAVGLVAAAVGLPAGAVETPVGSKNFTPPPYVPNYFSNETGAFTGAHGRATAAPVYVAPRVYPRSSYGYAAATRRFVHRPGHIVSRSRYRHVMHGRGAARRHFVHVAARGGRRPALRTRASSAHHRVAHPHARSASVAKRVARAGR